MATPGAQRLRILVAEDEPNDRKLLSLAVQAEDVAEWLVVSDGTEVIEYLDGEDKYADRQVYPFPDVVVLDLKMPLLSGLEVLEWIREESRWPRLPVVLLSGSGLERDVDEAYQLGANSYFQKPHSVAALKSVLRLIAQYWAATERPKRRRDQVIY